MYFAVTVPISLAGAAKMAATGGQEVESRRA